MVGKDITYSKEFNEIYKKAYQMLEEGQKSGKLDVAVQGAKLLDIGDELPVKEREKVLKYLLNSTNVQSIGEDRRLLDWIDYFRAKYFPDKFPRELVPEGNPEPDLNAEYKPSFISKRIGEYNKKNLETKIMKSVFAIFVLAGLFFGVSGMPGAVIGLSKSVSISSGVILFVFGIVGLFFSRHF